MTIGKVFTRIDADISFGKVISSVFINTSDLQDLLLQTTNYIMFSIIDGELVVLDNNRVPLYPANLAVSSIEVFHLLSVSTVHDLLAKGNNDMTYFENRQNVLTLTNGDYSLEESQLCPPFCY